MAKARIPVSEGSKQRKILDAALHCILQHGYSKTSMEDVAKQANISRPAIYLLYKNKTDLCQAVSEDLLQRGNADAEVLLESNLSRKEKLTALCERMILDAWSAIAGQPRTDEFFTFCCELDAPLMDKHQRLKIKLAQAILEDKEAGEIFVLALEGFYSDLPTTQVLRKRISCLIDRFVR